MIDEKTQAIVIDLRHACQNACSQLTGVNVILPALTLCSRSELVGKVCRHYIYLGLL
jgi:hypothetical protein